MNYERETLNAYRTESRAAEYKRHHTQDWSWARFCTWRKERILARELARYDWSAEDKLLDIPCGTGFLGKLLHSFPFRIIASDISPEMTALARNEYPADRLIDCVIADITDTRFPRASFACVVTLGFLHRVPAEIKRNTLREIAELSNRVVIVSCSVDTPLQRLKHHVLLRLIRSHIPAPCPIPMTELIEGCEAVGLQVKRTYMVVPFLSTHVILVLEKE